MSFRIFLLLATLALGPASTARSLSPVQQVADQLQLLSAGNLSYRYRVSLVETNSRTVVDSNSGWLYRSGAHFLDSNREFYTAITSQYFCKLDKTRRIASVYDLAAMRRRLGLKAPVPSAAVNIIDSISFKSPVPVIDSTFAGVYRATWQLQLPTPSSFSIYVDRKTYKLLSVRIETLEYLDRSHSYKRICVITDINKASGRHQINLDGIFRLEAKKVVMNPKYAAYTIKSLID